MPNGNGANQFNITDQNLFKSDGCYVSLLADINGDGLVDILRYSAPTNLDGGTCSSYGPVYVYLNNGNGSFTRQPFVGPTLERALSTSIDNCLVRRLPNGGQIIYQRPGPIKNDIPNHSGPIVAFRRTKARTVAVQVTPPRYSLEVPHGKHMRPSLD